MRIMVDARKLNDFGIGTYIEGVIGACSHLRPGWQFVLLGAPAQIAAGLPESCASNVSWLEDRSPKYSLRELSSLAQQANDADVDLFHAPHYVYPVGLRCPGVVTIHDCIHLRFPELLPRPFGILPRRLSLLYARRMMRHAVRSSSRIITVSEASRRDVLGRLGARARAVVTIPNGCDRYFLESPGAGELDRLAAHLSLPPEYILFVGNAKPHKNLDRLLAAFARIADARPQLHLLLAGGGAAADAIMSGVAVDVAQRIRGLGFVSRPELRALYHRARMLCLPSLYEGFGLPALEAMACGVPVVAAAAGGLPELVAEAGLLVDPRSVEDIAAALSRILTNATLSQRLREAGPARAAGFTWERSARATLRVYERTAARDTAP